MERRITLANEYQCTIYKEALEDVQYGDQHPGEHKDHSLFSQLRYCCALCSVHLHGQWPDSGSKKDKLENKAKGVASVWWADFIQFLAALGVLPRSIRKNRMNLTFSLK